MTIHYDADVIVVGSGVLGANAAYELAKAGKSVIMLEAGVRIPRWKIVENFRNASNKQNFMSAYPNAPWAHSSYDADYLENVGSYELRPGMLKVVGGTTWHWSAACWRHLPVDMKLFSTYGVGRDWPIEYGDLEPYYQRAEEALGVAGIGGQDQSGHDGGPFPPRSKPYPLPPEAKTYLVQRLEARIEPLGFKTIHEPHARASRPYDGRPACAGNNSCMPVCPIGAMYSGIVHVEHAIEAGTQLRTDATAYRLEQDGGGRIVAVHYRSSGGSDIRLTARVFIVAAHAIETAKLLLLSDVGNASNQVGRNLMEHSGMRFSFLADEPLWSGRGSVQQGGIFTHRDGPFRSQHSSIKHSYSNGVPNDEVTRRLLGQGVLGPDLDRQIRDQASRWVSFYTMLEALPRPTNRVSLNPARRDALGLPMLRIRYDLEPYVTSGREVALVDLHRFAKAMNGTLVDGSPKLGNGDHVMGTVVMGADPRTSVVDGDCRVHAHANLFLATTGVFPAASSVNPTLTGVALAIRVANTVAKEV